MSDVDIVNLALLELGISQTIGALADETKEAQVATLLYAQCRKYVLADFAWPFNEKIAELVGPCIADADYPASPEYQFAFIEPTDCLKPRRLVIPGLLVNPNPPPFRRGRFDTAHVTAWSGATTYDENDVVFRLSVYYVAIAESTNQQPPDLSFWAVVNTAKVIFTDEEEPTLAYAIDVTDTDEYDAHFVDCLAAYLAARMAPSLGRDQRVVANMLALYEMRKQQAQANHANAGQLPKAQDAEWISGR